jgi:hypothetical protein
MVATLPIPVILRLDMTRRQRWSVASLLCLGGFVVAVGCVRTHYLWILFDSDDLTWYAAPYWVCSEIEICVAMVAHSYEIRFLANSLSRYVLAPHLFVRFSADFEPSGENCSPRSSCGGNLPDSVNQSQPKLPKSKTRHLMPPTAPTGKLLTLKASASTVSAIQSPLPRTPAQLFPEHLANCVNYHSRKRIWRAT